MQADLSVISNSFEKRRVIFIGEGYKDELMFSNLPEEDLDQLKFPDLAIGIAHKLAFNVVNESTNKFFRLSW